MCHMDPFRVDLGHAGRLAASEPAARAIGLELLAAVRPRVLIVDGNSEGRPWISPWAYVRSTAPNEVLIAREAITRTFHYKQMRMTSGPLSGMAVVGLPTLSRIRGNVLTALLGFIAGRIGELRHAANHEA